MKKLFAIALVTFTILSATIPAFATTQVHRIQERTTVKVGYLENYGIINNPVVQGSEGYGFEYLEKIEEYTDYDFEYVALEWAEGMEQLKNGEIDILAPASMSEDREETYDFVDTVFLREEINIYALEDSPYQYGQPQQLAGKTVGTLEGSIYEKRFKAYASQYSLEYNIKYTEPSSVVKDMGRGEIDLYVDGSLYLRDAVYSVGKLYTENLYLMLRKGNSSLKNTINSAMLALEADEPSFNEILWYKYYGNDSKAPRKLTANERTALQVKDVYTVGYHADLHPMSYILPNGEPHGYAIDVMNLLADKLDIEIRYVPLHDDSENCAEDVDFNLCPLSGACATCGTLSEPYVLQNLLVVKNAGLSNNHVKNILVKDYATFQIDDFLQQYPAATIHKSYSSADSEHIYDTVDIDCVILPDNSEMMIYDKTARNVNVLDVDVPSGIIVSNTLPKGVHTAMNKAVDSLRSDTVDELIIESIIELQATPTLMDTFIKYQVQILSVVLLIIAVFIGVLWKHHKNTKRLLEVDTLTGTMTQYKFTQEAQRILKVAQPNEYMMLLLDVDKFKIINKVYGTETGDKLLCILADSIKQNTTKNAVIGRVEGDAFVILTKASEITPMPMNDQFVKEVKGIGVDIPVYFSIGAYVIENTADHISYMLDNARTAKTYGKTIFGNTIHYFTKELQGKHEKESEILSSMEAALANEEFFIVVQPKLDLQTEQLVGGEVLVRWKKKDGTFIYPDEFIPLMEENKFIVHLDRYVLEKTCELIRDSKVPLPVLSVNVSATTMLEADFMKIGNEVLGQYGVKPQQLEVELTESVLDADYNRISNIISQLKKVGVAIAIDDFGKGASSLARIKEIEVDVLKLDKEFIDNNTGNEKGKLVLNNILSMARDLGITSLAEGIETKEQQDLLIRLGCEQGQGYYFDKPLSSADYLQRVAANASKYAFQNLVDSKKVKGYMTNFEYLPYAVAITQNDSHYTVLKANSLFYRIIGYTKSAFLQQHQNHLSEIFWGDHHLKLSMQPHGEDIDMEFDFRVQTEAGNIVWLHNHMHYDATRDLCFCNVIDITKERYAGKVPLSFDAYKAHQESLKWLEHYTKEYILVSDVETGDVVYMNHRAMDYLNYHDEADWQGKKHYQIEFGPEANIDEVDNLPVPEDCFVSREYYNQFHQMYVHVESRTITVLGRKMRLSIISDISAQKQVESEHSLQNTLHKCVEYLYTTTADATADNTATYELLLEQIKLHYDADRAYFYKFQEATAQVEAHYEVVAEGKPSGKNELQSLPLATREKLLSELYQYNLLIKQDLVRFEPWQIEQASAIYDAYGVESFVYGAVKDIQGTVVGFMGVDNPKEHKDNAELMLMLSRFVWLFVKSEETKKLQAVSNKLLQESMTHQQELMKLDEMSRMNVVEICQKNLRGATHETARIISVLSALRHYYGAGVVTVLEFSPDCKTYRTIYESLEDGIPSFVAEGKECPIALLQTAIDNFTKHMEFAVSTKDISMLTEKERKTWNQYGIVNTTSAPLYDRHGELFGMLCVNNITLDRRSKTLIYSVAKHITDYLITAHIHQKSIQDSLTGLLNKKETELRSANSLDCGIGGVLFIMDMDHFKSLNDTLGHLTGDEMLELAAQAVKDTFRSTDVQGRIGGDEFMVFCPEPITDELVKEKATAILNRCNQNYGHDGGILETSCTIGIARAEVGETFQSLYEKADRALYISKNNGKNQYHIYNEDSQ